MDSALLGVATTSRQVVVQGVIVPTLQRNAARVEAFIVNSDDLLLALLTDDDTGVTP
jgi:hypothetical protein